MRDLVRILLLLRGAGGWTVVAVGLGLVAVVANTGLLAVATYLISAAASHPPLYALAGALYLVRVFGLSRAFARYAERLVSHDVTFRLVELLRSWLTQRLVRLSTGQLLRLQSADLLARLVRDVDEVQVIFQHGVGPILVSSAAAIVVVAGMWCVAPQLGTVALTTFFILGVIIPGTTVASTRSLHRQEISQRAALDVALADHLQGLPDLLAFDNATLRTQLAAGLSDSLCATQQRLGIASALRLGTQDLVGRLGASLVLIIAIPLVLDQRFPSAYLGVTAILMLGVAEALEPLALAAQRLGCTRAAAQRMFAVADMRPALTFPREPYRASTSPRVLEFEHVDFAYSGESVLTDITFSVRPGRPVGIVGPSGAGKSTLLLLAARAWDPTCGEVRLDGRDIRCYSSEDITRTVTVLTGSSYVFSASLRDNLCLACPSASDSKLRSVLDLVGLGSVRDLALDTWVGDQGTRLSGGERQRVALARALLADTPFLVLDEPTHNLDVDSERSITAIVRALGRERGILVASHRLVELEWLEELLVLDRGRIVERGHASELEQATGLYRQMLEIQRDLLQPR